MYIAIEYKGDTYIPLRDDEGNLISIGDRYFLHLINNSNDMIWVSPINKYANGIELKEFHDKLNTYPYIIHTTPDVSYIALYIIINTKFDTHFIIDKFNKNHGDIFLNNTELIDIIDNIKIEIRNNMIDLI